MALWYDEVYEDRTRLGLRVDRTLYSGRSAYQTIEVLDTPEFGRVLVLDGVFNTSERDEHFYHEMLVHPALTTARHTRRVLVIGGGDGGTVREVLRHPTVERVVMVEIDRQVVEVCREHLPTIGSAWEDPRLELRFEDGIRFVREAEVEPFDVVLLDGTDPIGPGEELYRLDFYRGCARVLAEGGVFALQSESPFLQRDIFLGIQQRLREVFPEVHPYFGPVPLYGAGLWSWTWAARGGDPRSPDPERAAAAEGAARYYNRAIHAAAFAVPTELARALSRPR
ncbi:MAG: polyamine aminopropyltransferase [Myxococcota bacterium]